MKKKFISLKGESTDIEFVKSQLKFVEWKIIKESNSYYLTSDFLTENVENKDVELKAKQFVDIINGALVIILGAHKRIETTGIVEVSDMGTKSIFVEVNEKMKAQEINKAIIIRNGEALEEQISVFEELIKLAELYKSVQDVLHFFNEIEITWWNLYKIFEIIRDDLGSQKKTYEIVSKAELSLFTQAAQSRELLGDDARHASKKYPSPNKDITIIEAEQTVRKLFEGWIKLKK